ncbi:hypothetical protein C5167_051189 [Papaver somniferum]|uniref:Bet v I/Major latex protein domain-containing protein n=1 Tax=Papaver somniferum TaxID=3469 RepID=A0A4Y7KUX9_PAPSO|nr:S-norcoclaurine synthase 2-like [Papaver somniferum]RZC75705.1 hypothetical protein C5167_051189 [Papaver somniferum]
MKYQIVFSVFLLFSSIYSAESLKYTLISDLDVVGASADEIWALFASNDAPQIFQQLLPGVFEKIEVLEGNGGVGSVLRITYPKGSVPLTNKEKFVTIDNRRRLKEVLQTEGGYLDMGVTFFMESFEIIPKNYKSCIIKSMVRYTVPDAVASNVSHLISIEGLLGMAKVAAKYVIDNKKKIAEY